jgi:ubiquinone/menaquinone biosynthesis C-methylase UbiE
MTGSESGVVGSARSAEDRLAQALSSGTNSAICAAAGVKECCARLYESDIAQWLLGDSFHPGGLALTQRLGSLLRLTASDRVLDVACGRGASAIFIAEHFGCEVVGIDYGNATVEVARAQAAAKGLASRVFFRQGDAESLPFGEGEFDALICECAFCTFPDKTLAARDFARVLRPNGRLGLSDLTRTHQLPPDLNGLLAWIACIADALPANEYVELLRHEGFAVDAPELHAEALRELVHQVRGRLLAAEVMQGLRRIALPDFDFATARTTAKAAAAAIERGELGYVLITGTSAA